MKPSGMDEKMAPGTALALMARAEREADNARRVRQGFWPKLKRTMGRIPFADEAVAAYYCARDPATPQSARLIALAALAYFVIPADAVPDVLAMVGLGDDAAVFWAAWSMIERHVRPEHRARARALLDLPASDPAVAPDGETR